MRKSLTFFGLVLLLVSATNCSKCGKTDRAIESMVPADVTGAMIFPDLAQTVGDVKGLMDKFSVGPLATFINQGHLELTRVLGFDPLKIEELKKMGLDPARGMATVPAGQAPVIVIGVSDQKALSKEIEKRLAQLAAAEDVSTEKVDGFEVTTISTRVGEQKTPQIHYGFSGGFVLLASAKTSAADLARLANLREEQSLKSASWYQALRGKAPRTADMLVVLNASKSASLAPGMQAFGAQMDQGLILSFSMAPTGLDTDLYVGLKKETADRLNGFTGGVDDVHLERHLPADTLLAVKLRINVEKVLNELLGIDSGFKSDYEQAMAAAKQSMDADVEAGAVHNLTGNGVFGLSLGGTDQLGQLVKSLAEQPPEGVPTGLDTALQIYYWMQIRDGAAWAQLLDKLLPLATERAQLKVQRTEQGPLKVTELTGPEVRLSTFLLQKGDLIGICLGKGCPAKAAAIVEGKEKGLPSILSPGAKRLFDQPSLAVAYLNCGALLESLQKMDASVMGDGGMLAKMVLDLALTAIKNLRELTGVVRFLPDGVSFSLHLEIQ